MLFRSHVPELGSNLSVLYLTRHRGFNVHIYSERMDFDRDSQTLFCTTINASNTAYLAGTVHSALETAQAAATSTLPLDETLWHRRLAHYHLQGVRNIAQSDVVTGMKLEALSQDPSLKQEALERFPDDPDLFAQLKTAIELELPLAKRSIFLLDGPPSDEQIAELQRNDWQEVRFWKKPR